MQCPITPELWQHYQDTGDDQVAAHLASCDSCRAEAGRLTALEQALASLKVATVPGAMMQRLQALHDATQTESLTCTETLTLLEAWREDELPRAQAFLVEDHLLWCEPCTAALAQAELLTTALRTLPMLEAPAVIAERIAQARVPWWQRLLPAPAPSWSRQFGVAAGLAAALMLMFGSVLQSPRLASLPEHQAVTPVNGTATNKLVVPETYEPVVATVATVAHTSTSAVAHATTQRQIRGSRVVPTTGSDQHTIEKKTPTPIIPVSVPKNAVPEAPATDDPVIAVQPGVPDTEDRVRVSSVPSDTSPQRIIETEVKAAKWGEDETNYSDAVNNIRLRL